MELVFGCLKSHATFVITLIKLFVQRLGRVGFFLFRLEKGKVWVGVVLVVLFFAASFPGPMLTSSDQSSGGGPGNGYSCRTWFHVHGNPQASPLALSGLTPSQVKSAYKLPPSGGVGTTIAIVDAYDDPTVVNDLNVFSRQYDLTPVSFAELKTSAVDSTGGWELEESLDVEWAHAIAPNATILLVEANSSSFADLLSAISYATSQPNVVAVSMSWGGGEFSGETSYDSYFVKSGVTFFASSGDNGAGVI